MSPKNTQILADRMAEFNAITGPRVGDFIQLPLVHARLATLTRITHHWGDTVQTGGMSGSFYLTGSAGMSYSGGLDHGVAVADILPDPVGERAGSLWFFDEGRAGMGRGINTTAPMRIYALREGADVSGIGELKTPYWLNVLDERAHKQTCGYWFCVTKHCMSHTAFRTAEELTAWLAREGLALTAPLTPAGVSSSQNLQYV